MQGMKIDVMICSTALMTTKNHSHSIDGGIHVIDEFVDWFSGGGWCFLMSVDVIIVGCVG